MATATVTVPGAHKELARSGLDVIPAVAGDTARGGLARHPRAVCALHIVVLRRRVTLAAHVGDLLVAGRCGAVLPVTGRAGGRAQVLFVQQRHAVDTGLV